MPDERDPGHGLEGIDPQQLERLSELMAERKVGALQRRSNPKSVESLREACSRLAEKSDLKVGDVVRWKPDLRNKNFPAYDVPCVVAETLDEPILSPEESAGSTYFREPLDIVLGLYVDDEPSGGDKIRMYHFDGRRFELHPDFLDQD